MQDLKKVRGFLKTQNLDAVLLSAVSNITYLTSYAGFSHTERDAYVLVTAKKIYLFTSPLYSKEVTAISSDIQVIEHNSSFPFTKNLTTVVKKDNLEKIGFESTSLSVAEYLKITENCPSRFISSNPSLIRIIKSEKEIAAIQKACSIGDAALKSIMKYIKPGSTEQQFALLLEMAIRKTGCDLSFPTIVAFGKNAAVPHHHTGDTALKSNDTILIDFGVLFDNYCSDMTRTFFVGTATKEQQKVWDTVARSQQLAVEWIKTALKENKTINALEVDQVAREYIISQGYPTMPHSLGHGIGIEVHEAPTISPRSQETLIEGMVFSIEPGIYLPDKFGVRIEDLYAIHNNNIVQLTHAPLS